MHDGYLFICLSSFFSLFVFRSNHIYFIHLLPFLFLIETDHQMLNRFKISNLYCFHSYQNLLHIFIASIFSEVTKFFFSLLLFFIESVIFSHQYLEKSFYFCFLKLLIF